jgi:hypothetical protein
MQLRGVFALPGGHKHSFNGRKTHTQFVLLARHPAHNRHDSTCLLHTCLP